MDVAAEFNAAFDVAIADLVAESGLPVSEWFKSGVSKPETAIENWRKLGPESVQNFIDWWEGNNYSVWLTPDDRPAIELELDVMFGSVPVKAYIDLVAVNDEHLAVIDSKSGAVVPDSPQQLGFYASMLELKYGIRPLMGAHFMTRGAGRNKDIFLTEPRPLSGPELSIEFFTNQLEAMERGRAADGFVARVGKHCGMCDVAQFCAAVGGEYSRLVDPDHRDFVPF
jgi:hypothetical protein